MRLDWGAFEMRESGGVAVFRPRTSAQTQDWGQGGDGRPCEFEELPPEACWRPRAETLGGRKIVPVITHPPRGYHVARSAQKSRLATPPPAGLSLPSFASSGPPC